MVSTTDATYSSPVHIEQNGKNLIIGSTGTVYIQSGGKLVVESGGVVQLSSGSSFLSSTPIENSSVGYFKRQVLARTTATKAAEIPLGSHCAVTATTGAPVYKLATPVAGAEITVVLTAQTSNVGCQIYSGSTGVAMATSGTNAITLVGQNQVVRFIGRTATRWDVQCNSSIAFATYTT